VRSTREAKFLDTVGGTGICTARIADVRAGGMATTARSALDLGQPDFDFVVDRRRRCGGRVEATRG
jgi:hypothetical protein